MEEQLSWMDWFEYVTVKKSKGIDDAVLKPVEEVHKELQEAAKRVLENIFLYGKTPLQKKPPLRPPLKKRMQKSQKRNILGPGRAVD